MKNKTVIRKKLVNGEFTTIHNSILFDTRLTPNGFRLFTAILSDSDTNFDLSQTLYCDRLGIAKQTFFNAIANLEECGYLRKKDIGKETFIPKIKKANSEKKVYHYTLSEYGNLKSESQELVPIEIHNSNETDGTSIDEVNASMIDMNEYIKQVESFLLENFSLMDENFLKNVMVEAFYNNEPLNSLIEKFEKYLYKNVLASITDSHTNPKAFEDFKQSSKSLIFKHKNYKSNFMSSWNYKKLTTHKKQAPRDYETEMFDYYENPED